MSDGGQQFSRTNYLDQLADRIEQLRQNIVEARVDQDIARVQELADNADLLLFEAERALREQAAAKS